MGEANFYYFTCLNLLKSLKISEIAPIDFESFVEN